MDELDNLTFEEFHNLMSLRLKPKSRPELNSFQLFWKQENQIAPLQFPSEQSLETWAECFRTWCEGGYIQLSLLEKGR